MLLASSECYQAAALAGLAPDPEETVSEWADRCMKLPAGENAEPGRWRTSRFPFIKAIMDDLSPNNHIREVNYMKPVQMAGTSALTCWGGYTIARSPCNMLVVEPTIDFARKLSKQRFDPMIDLVPPVKTKLKSLRSRDTGNNILEKEFLGGRLVFTGANSGNGLRFMSAKNLGLDECDAYPFFVDNEGRPCDIAEKRTATFNRYKIFRLSTPLIKETSVIEPAYLDSNQQKFFVPCPFCDHGQHLELENLVWPKGKPWQAAYLCALCRAQIPEHKKTQMLEAGIWQSTLSEEELQGLDGTKSGYHINILCQPYGMRYSWAHIAAEWTAVNKTNDLTRRQSFYNLFLAETWQEELGEKHAYSDLWNRREIYPAPVPPGIKAITAFIDTQDNRLEGEIRGWGHGRESWGLDMRVFLGSPSDTTKAGPWAAVDQWLQQTFHHPDLGELGIQVAGIDSGGHFTKEVYDFARNRPGRVFATKGSNKPGAPLFASKSYLKESKLYLYSIGTDAAKDSIYANLKMSEPGPGYFHWPKQVVGYDEEYFQQVCAEVKIPVKVRGRVVGTRYVKHRDRNEGIDLLVGNWFLVEVLARYFGVDLNQFTFDYREPHANQAQRNVSAQRQNWVPRQNGSTGTPRGGGWLKR